MPTTVSGRSAPNDGRAYLEEWRPAQIGIRREGDGSTIEGNRAAAGVSDAADRQVVAVDVGVVGDQVGRIELAAVTVPET